MTLKVASLAICDSLFGLSLSIYWIKNMSPSVGCLPSRAVPLWAVYPSWVVPLWAVP